MCYFSICLKYIYLKLEFSARSYMANPLHPYTKALMSAIPQKDPSLRGKRTILKGEVPSIMNPPSGCHFHPRCNTAEDRCRNEDIPFCDAGDGHLVRCWKAL